MRSPSRAGARPTTLSRAARCARSPKSCARNGTRASCARLAWAPERGAAYAATCAATTSPGWSRPAPRRPSGCCLERFETLRLELNRELQLGLLDFECHFAVYPPGAFYRRHLDRFATDDRRTLSCVLYLNDAWSAQDGGALRLHLGRRAPGRAAPRRDAGRIPERALRARGAAGAARTAEPDRLVQAAGVIPATQRTALHATKKPYNRALAPTPACSGAGFFHCGAGFDCEVK